MVPWPQFSVLSPNWMDWIRSVLGALTDQVEQCGLSWIPGSLVA